MGRGLITAVYLIIPIGYGFSASYVRGWSASKLSNKLNLYGMLLFTIGSVKVFGFLDIVSNAYLFSSWNFVKFSFSNGHLAKYNLT